MSSIAIDQRPRRGALKLAAREARRARKLVGGSGVITLIIAVLVVTSHTLREPQYEGVPQPIRSVKVSLVMGSPFSTASLPALPMGAAPASSPAPAALPPSRIHAQTARPYFRRPNVAPDPASASVSVPSIEASESSAAPPPAPPPPPPPPAGVPTGSPYGAANGVAGATGAAPGVPGGMPRPGVATTPAAARVALPASPPKKSPKPLSPEELERLRKLREAAAKVPAPDFVGQQDTVYREVKAQPAQ